MAAQLAGEPALGPLPATGQRPRAASARVMYARHFGLKHEPFSIAPDPRFLYMSERHREALAHLLYGVRSGGGFVLLSGEIGAGKTTVCRCFLEQVPASCNVAYILNPKLSVGELLATVCEEFGIADAGNSTKQRIDALNGFLLATHAAGRSSVLIIDEAQMLSADVLEQLRLLTNLETHERKLLQIILIGQPELRRLIAQARMEQLAQRVIARYHLAALSEPETAGYVRHRLAVAGLSGPLPFTAKALRRVHRVSGGVPRRINLLCDRALLAAYSAGRTRIDARLVERSAREVFDRPRRGHRWWLLGVVALVVIVLLAAAAWWALRGDGTVAAVTASVPAAAALPASATASPSSGAALPVEAAVAPPARPAPLSAAEFAARQPWHDEADAWRALGRLWQLDIAAADPCSAIASLGLACYKGRATLGELQQLDRPVLLALGASAETPAWALLTGLDDRQARLTLADGTASVSLATLAAQWHGDIAALWRPPPGYSGDAAAAARGAFADWLRDSLQAFQGDTLPAATPLRQRIEAFQRAQGLPPDGLAGPMTLMQLNRAAGESGPRLHAE